MSQRVYGRLALAGDSEYHFSDTGEQEHEHHDTCDNYIPSRSECFPRGRYADLYMGG